MCKLFKRFQRKEVSMILLCLLFIVGQVWLDLTMRTTCPKSPPWSRPKAAPWQISGWPGGKMLLCALGSLILSVMTGFLAAQVGGLLLHAAPGRDLPAGGEFFHGGDQPLFHRQPHHPDHQRRHPNSVPDSHGPAGHSQGPHHGSMGHLQNPVQKLAVDRRHLCRRGIYAGADCHCCHLCHARFKRIQALTDNLNRSPGKTSPACGW